MLHAMPSLISLRAFEAAARLGSFKDAAEELSVSPTAVSHHVRGLEQALDVQLFVRETRAVHLTDTGRRLSERLTSAFTEIGDALSEVHATEHDLTVTTTPAFAALWLVPRMEAFQAAHPDIRLRLETGTAPVDLARDRRIDVAIRYGGDEGPCLARALPPERIGLYGAPDVAVALGGRLNGATILTTDWEQPGLPSISPEALTVGASAEDRPKVRQFKQEHHVAQCAIAGQGLALLSDVLAGDLVARGLLKPVRPDIQVRGLSYGVLCLPERARVRKIATFIRWLEAAFTQT
ncbi:transcriptional regulator, LysR family [Caenispirillum salinarum AK4]|uniref:Transcriptional regulator, LysR family n=1 Tax=Caenispirillum salinarum AK4 TaxID=1238182 RepID=K9H410_9PROT|nr:LysR substrate-binding domain-containing protein [Caenispirillum salinarum]EKV31799.1 transcriptional regulator, LysR family [Caenispirillum salinarum AK4]